MCERPEDFVVPMREFVTLLDASRLHPQRATELFEKISEVARLADAALTLLAGCVEETRVWRAAGSSSAAAWVADRMGAPLGHATAMLNTADRISELPLVREALLAGELSAVQADEISAAAIADADAQETLLSHAATESVASLRERCRDVRAAAIGDENANERIRRGRYLRHWQDRDNAVRIDARMAPDDAAPLIAVIDARAHALSAEARASRQLETFEAYAADALTSLVDGSSVKTVVNVHVSGSALDRGHTIAGETSRIDGVTPISVGAAKRLAINGFVKILETDGADVRRVVHAGRSIPARLRTVLEVRDPTCVVPGCNRRYGLEIDHVTPFALGGPASLENLVRLCRYHHSQKTLHGWRLEGEPGNWIWKRGPHRDRSPPAAGG
ncbi:MAG: HNH endonuclease signature motif containing protein [Actinomycetota bacterium]|nr:HNH endonuclease [Actinomycetota bacterium]